MFLKFFTHDSAWHDHTVTLRDPIPVNNFWVFTKYYGQIRSVLARTREVPASTAPTRNSIAVLTARSRADLFRRRPKGEESNLVQTMPVKSDFMLLRAAEGVTLTI